MSARRFFAAAALCALPTHAAVPADEPERIVLEPGAPAPAWTLSGPGGEASFPAAAAGRPAIILFWATWCPYCKALMPYLQRIRADYAGHGVQLFAINVWEDGDPVEFMAAHGYDFVLLLDGDAVAERYGVYGTPGLFVVDADGRVRLNRYLIDLSELPIDEQMSRRERAALSAPAWAAVVRDALDAAL